MAETEDLSAPDGIVVALPFSQSLSPDRARPFLRTPFVWSRDDGTCALVQAWSETAASLEGGECVRHNPDPAWYEPRAVDEFRGAMAALFGEEAVAQVGVEFSYVYKDNPIAVYVGLAEALLRFLEQNHGVAQELGIAALRTDGARPSALSFTFGTPSSAPRSFTFEHDCAYVIYRVGVLPLSVKTLLEFEMTATFNKVGRKRSVMLDQRCVGAV